MKYAAVEEYRFLCGDDDSTDDEIARNIFLAEAAAEELTMGRLRAMHKSGSLTPFQKECVKCFVCFEAEYLKENPQDSGDISSYTVGSISVTVKSGKSEADMLHVSPKALSFLDRSGLRWRGI